MKTLIAILVIFSLYNKATAQKNAEITGKIVTNNHEGLLNMKAVAKNNSEIHYNLNYILVSVKKGKSGSSSNKQSGKFTLMPKETKTISEINVNLSKNDGLKVFLFVKDEETDQVLSKDSLEINGDQFKSEVSFIPEYSIELSGLTIDETKTKFGQFFYELFFNKYNQLPTKFEGTVTISEQPMFGRNTRITISYDDQIIYAFMSKPDEESMNAEAERSLALLARYSAQNTVRNKEFKY